VIKRIFWTVLTLGSVINTALASKELPESFSRNIPQLSAQSHYTFEAFDQKVNELEENSKGEPHRFAISSKPTSPMDYNKGWNKSGVHRVWRAQFSSKHAKSINLKLSLTSFNALPKIFFYSEDRTQIFGPLKPNANGEIWTPIIEKKYISSTSYLNAILEIDMKEHSGHTIPLTVDAINLGFKALNKNRKAEGCQLDITCDEATPYQNQARSVARYSVLGQYFCSGTLVNNSLNDSRAYFLTAKHCEITNSSAGSMVFYWNYQSSECNGDRDGDLSQTTSGASLRASSYDSDFALLELDELPPQSFLPYLSGWSAEENIPATTFSIHHPYGNEKSISFDFEPPEVTQAYSDTINSNGYYFRVGGWELGSTTEGSSGAGLWNSEGKLVGTLTGGLASCREPQAPDWYSRLSSQWSHETWKHNQLAFWLSPEESLSTTAEGSEICSTSNFSIQLSNNSPSLDEEVTYSVNNVDENASVEWDFNNDGVYDINAKETTYVYNFVYKGNIRVKVTQESGCSTSQVKLVNVQNNSHEYFPIGGRLSALWNQTRTSDRGWRLDTSRSFEGQYSLKSDPVQNGQTAGIEFVHNYTAGQKNFVSFAVSTSTQSGDILRFYVDNKLVDQWQGDNAWQVNYYPVQPGLRIFKWVYEKDSDGQNGSDAVWIDAVSGFEREESESGGGASFVFILFVLLIKRKSRDIVAASN